MHKPMNIRNPVLIHYWLTRWLVGSTLILYLIHAPVIVAQPDGDRIPPPLGVADSLKTIVVALNFQNSSVTGHSAHVVFGQARDRIGPPLLRIDLFDFRGNLVDQFNEWHPLWTFVRDETGSERLVIGTEGTTDIAFPFAAEAGTMHVIDVEQDQEILSVNLIPTIRSFCDANPNDPDCRNIADFDGDRDVDNDDLNLLLADRNTPVSESACGEPCDLNVDGVIDALDARKLVTLCTRPQCATQ